MLKMMSIDRFCREYNGQSVILIGAGKRARRILNQYDWNFKFAIDNNPNCLGSINCSSGVCVKVYDWSYLKNNCDKNDIVIITPIKGYKELLSQAEKDVGYIDIYIYDYMEALQWDADRINESRRPFDITKGVAQKIPKVIHYFWFSGDPYPDKVKRCIDSWHKFCPDYELKLWNTENYKTDNAFFNEALSKKAWSIASDFSRCDVLYRYGGIYLDVDVELVRPLDDLLFDEGFFCFQGAEGVDPGSGMASVEGHPIFRDICKRYEGLHYIHEEGMEQYEDILFQYNTVLDAHGMVRNGYYQKVENIAIYPPLVFSPYSSMTGIDSRYENTYGIHHWVSNWLDEETYEFWNNRKKIISSYVMKKGGIKQVI